MSPWWSRSKNIVRVVRMQGIIRNGQGNVVNLRSTEKDIDKAFDCKKVKPKAVCLEVNSMGGSAVQSSIIYERAIRTYHALQLGADNEITFMALNCSGIRYLSQDKNVPVITFAEDFAVSGGYLISLAGDEIYVNPSSIVGSIGVIVATFGLQDAIAKLGIERRVFTSSENKSRLDVFRPSKASDEKWVKEIMDDIENEFKKIVIERRPGLQKHHPTVFTGDTFTGKRAAEIGLVDGVTGDSRQIIYDKFGKDVIIERPKRPFWKRFSSNYVQLSTINNIESMNGLLETLQEARIESTRKL